MSETKEDPLFSKCVYQSGSVKEVFQRTFRLKNVTYWCNYISVPPLSQKAQGSLREVSTQSSIYYLGSFNQVPLKHFFSLLLCCFLKFLCSFFCCLPSWLFLATGLERFEMWTASVWSCWWNHVPTRGLGGNGRFFTHFVKTHTKKNPRLINARFLFFPTSPPPQTCLSSQLFLPLPASLAFSKLGFRLCYQHVSIPVRKATPTLFPCYPYLNVFLKLVLTVKIQMSTIITINFNVKNSNTFQSHSKFSSKTPEMPNTIKVRVVWTNLDCGRNGETTWDPHIAAPVECRICPSI